MIGRALAEIGKGYFQCSMSYMRNHLRFFDWASNTLEYPICQNSAVGFVRSPLDRQKLVDYMSRLVQDSIKFGQVFFLADDQGSKQARQAQVVDHLRKVAFAPPPTPHQDEE